MKSVGLLTMHRVVNNCGSCLQTLATVKVVDKLGYACTVIDYLYPTAYHKLKPVGNDYAGGGTVRRLLKKIGILDYVRVLKLWFWQWRDRKRLRAFLGSFDHTSAVGRDTLSSLPSFDIYLTGSDQTWNARYLAEDYTYLLDFVPDNVRKISYGASFGDGEVLPDYRETYAQLLSRYDAISVREASGIGTVRDLTGKPAVHVADPTLLLTADEWRPLSVCPEAASERFVFCYALSYFDPGPWFVKAIAEIARRLDAKVVFYTDGLRLQEAREAGFAVLTGTLLHQEFLGYVDRAAFVVTTSFHGTAFSLNFRKDFLSAINPKVGGKGRVGSLLKEVGLSMRGVSDANDVPWILEHLSVDYSQAEIRLEELRQFSIGYLKTALEGGHA